MTNHADGASRDDLRRWLRTTAGALVVLVGATMAVLWLRGLSGIPVYYFYSQDVVLLLAAAAALLMMAWQPLEPYRPIRLFHPIVAGLIAAAAAFAYAGTWFAMSRYTMSRDEVLAEFAATHLRRGGLGWPIPVQLHDVARAMMPVGSAQWIESGYWVSGYLPVNSALRAMAAAIGDSWLAGPILLAIGLAALWSSARRLWPETIEPASVALLLALTSTQLLVNAMTPFAMTAQFALHAMWIACFLRGGRLGHSLAIGIGLFASGLHQFHFHLIFVSGFIVWSWLSGRRSLALCYVAACIGYQFVWNYVYPHLLIATLGPISDASATPLPATHWLTEHIKRLAEFEPFSSFARFAAWQNVLLLPLALLGRTRFRRTGGTPLPIALAFQLSCMLGLALMVYQGYGYGYRYLHGLLPCFLLLAAGGWTKLIRRYGEVMPRHLMAIATSSALCVTLPYALWQSHALMRPYAKAYAMARAAPADVVLVDGRGGGFLQDIVRIEDRVSRPLILDLGFLRTDTLRTLCARRTVMLFDGRQAHAAGIMGTGTGDTRDYPAQAAAGRRTLAALNCETPVPVTR
jgi:hypothetical protein